MLPERSTGLILRTRPLTETSLIIHWLTPDLGRLATVAKGARRPKSPFRGKLDLFYLAEFSFARSKRSDLHTLREVSLLETHAGLRRDLGCLEQAAYGSALIEQSTETESPLPEVYQMFSSLLCELTQHPAQPQTVFAFELKLLADLGLQPDVAETKLPEGTRLLLKKMAGSDWPAIFRLRLSETQTAEIRQFLHGYLIYHLERVPRNRSRALDGASPICW